MTSPKDVSFFLLDLGSLDVLLPAGDFKTAASAPETPKSSYLRLEDSLARLLPGLPRAEKNPSSSIFFYRLREGTSTPEKDSACLIDRPFELKEYPFKEIRPIPACLRAALAKEGVIAVRFGTGGRIQIVLDTRPVKGRPA